MNTARTKSEFHVDDEITASIPQLPTPDIGPGHPNFFPLHAILEIKGFLGKIEANIEHLTKSVDGLKVKVDDLVRWKTLIFGGFIVVGISLSGATWLMNKFTIEIATKPSISHISPTQLSRAEPGPPQLPGNANHSDMESI